MNFLWRELAKPLLERAGSLIALVLVTEGVAVEQANIVENAVVAVGFVLIDLVLLKAKQKGWRVWRR